ncbi:MAG: hypothetical protein ABIG71_04915 [Candidatus Uhrbacteria bacterium]
MSPQHCNEQIDVLATFTAGGVRPYSMKWDGHRYEPLQVHMTHTVRDGRKLWHVFSCSDPANSFTIAFNPFDLRWQLWEYA